MLGVVATELDEVFEVVVEAGELCCGVCCEVAEVAVYKLPTSLHTHFLILHPPEGHFHSWTLQLVGV